MIRLCTLNVFVEYEKWTAVERNKVLPYNIAVVAQTEWGNTRLKEREGDGRTSALRNAALCVDVRGVVSKDSFQRFWQKCPNAQRERAGSKTL